MPRKVKRKKTNSARPDANQPLTYIDAIRLSLLHEMEQDPSVFIMGEDIGRFGGAFKATKGLLETFGDQRVIDTPIGENGLIGMSIGAAMMGMRPIVEMQFADFVSNGFTQLAEQAAKIHYRVGIKIPIVVRLPCGGGLGAGPFHSTNPEGWFTNVPGLKIVAPSTPSDAYHLLRSSIRDNNPVLFLEHKWLYRRVKEEICLDSFDGDASAKLGQGKIVRNGTNLTIVTYHSMVQHSLAAAQALASEGIEVEIIDLRTLIPWDRQLILESVSRTSRLLVVHEATRTGGFGAEVAAEIGELGFDSLDAPVRRLASIDTPVPFAAPLEQFFMPNAEKIINAARALVQY